MQGVLIYLEIFSIPFYLYLNEAFSSSTNETEFILASDQFQRIVESKAVDAYSDITQLIPKKLKENSEKRYLMDATLMQQQMEKLIQ